MKMSFNLHLNPLAGMVFLCASGLVGLSGQINAQAADFQDPTFSRISTSKEIRIGYVNSEPPFSYEENGQATGYAIDICKAVVDEIESEIGKVNTSYVALDAADRVEAFAQQKIDMLCADTAESLSARKIAAFSIPIYFDGLTALVSDATSDRAQAIFAGEVPKDRPAWRASLASILQDVPIVVVEGSDAAMWVETGLQQFNLSLPVSKVSTNQDALEAMKKGEAQAYFASRSVLTQVLTAGDMTDSFYITPMDYTRTPIGVAFALPAPWMTLTADTALSKLYKSGEVLKIYERYFGPADDNVRMLYGLTALPD